MAIRQPALTDSDAAEVFDGESPSTQTALNPHQKAAIYSQTPAKYIKYRTGRGGKEFAYVEVGYVINKLNQAFGHFWDWEITEQQIGNKQVWVKGKLTVKSLENPHLQIIKTAFGGSAIKTLSSGEIIDVADDLKAASADALKKAASMLGIASDIYYPMLDRLDED